MRGAGQRSPGGGDVDFEVTANLGIWGGHVDTMKLPALHGLCEFENGKQ